MLMNHLQNHAIGKREMTPSQVQAAMFLVSQRIGKPAQTIDGTVAHTHNYDEMLLALINGRSPQARDDTSAEPTTH